MNMTMGDSSHAPREFNSTHWSLVSRARSGDSDVRHEALSQLLATNYGALRAHLVAHMRIDRHRSEDLLQSFICRKILQRDLMQRAVRNKGRLRSLLLKSLENFVRTEMARARREGNFSLDDASEMAFAGRGPDVFDVAWARSLLMEALSRMRAQCEAPRRRQLWMLLETRVVAPALAGSMPLSYDELVVRFGFGSPQEASNALITAKRQFKRTLREVIGESVHSEEEIDDELIELRTILATAKPDQPAISLLHDVAQPSVNPILAAVDETDPSALARLIEIRIDRDSLWDEADFSGYLKHQLAIPLAMSFPKIADQPGLAAATIACFKDLLGQRVPHLGLLKAIKSAARDAISRRVGGMPDQVAAVFYFGSIAMALVRRGTRISKSEDSVLRHGLQAMLDQAWVPAPLAQLFREALARLTEAA